MITVGDIKTYASHLSHGVSPPGKTLPQLGTELRKLAEAIENPDSEALKELVLKIRHDAGHGGPSVFDVEKLISFVSLPSGLERRWRPSPPSGGSAVTPPGGSWVNSLATAVSAGYRLSREEAVTLLGLAVQAGAAEAESAPGLRPVDPIGKPGHYATGAGGFVQDHCDAFELRCETAVDRGLPPGTERFLGGMEHNATKYIWRAGEKPQPDKTGPEAALRDWSAALWYVTRGVEHLKRLVKKENA